jgi:sterol desaturase/sphingolipid hydroxylase (fatty acid hydroxylase superfamily)
MLDYLIEQKTFLLVVLAIFITVSLVEIVVSRNGRQVTVSDRLRNIGAGAVFLIVGGYIASLAIEQLMRLHVFRISRLDPFVYVGMLLLLYDSIYYFYHRLQHSWAFLWGVHKVHHTDTDVNVTSSHRTHLLDSPIAIFVVYTPSIMLMGIHPSGLLYTTYIGMFFLYFSHSKLNIDLGPASHVFVGPRFHRIHHSRDPAHLNKNFSQFFSFLDRVFGTFASPMSLLKVETGVQDCQSLREQWAPLLWPVPLPRSSRSTSDQTPAPNVSPEMELRGRIQSSTGRHKRTR